MTNTGCTEYNAHKAIDQSKAISGDVIEIAYSYAAECMLYQECEHMSGHEYSGTDIDGNDWTVRLV